ncbi:hypothetical protein [Aquimarina sp. I32.4]|uniref:hypothetical protein n=1 Tax=Aquimarina sp. I32.4 TaxID=2053903 RepID=UPI0011AF3E7E|nr:hypothetical protein [Aquimarina sp. I32.4]
MKNILFLILLMPIGLFAQTKKDIEPRNESFITIDILSPFFSHYGGRYYTPRWRLGYIKNLNEKAKIGIDIGYGDANISLINTGDKYSLWEIRPEYYRIINPKRKTLKYFAVEAFYINQKERFISQHFFDEQNNYRTFDKADYSRQKFGVIPKFGMFINLSNQIGLNLYTGIGISYRINKYSNFVNLIEDQYNTEHFRPYYRNEGYKIRVEFTFGMKLYYRIKN